MIKEIVYIIYENNAVRLENQSPESLIILAAVDENREVLALFH